MNFTQHSQINAKTLPGYYKPIINTLGYVKFRRSVEIICAVGIISVRKAVSVSTCINGLSVGSLEVVVFRTLTPVPVIHDVEKVYHQNPIVVLIVSFPYKLTVLNLRPWINPNIFDGGIELV